VSVVVDPEAGGRIAELTIAGLDVLRERRDDPMQWGCFPMAPFAGRVRRGRFEWHGRAYEMPINLPPHAIHGTTFDRPWEVVSADEQSATLRIDLVDPWPFGGHVVQHLRLEPEALHLRMEVHCGDEPMPVSCGWHPWFRRDLGRGGPAELEFEAEAMYLRDAEGIPTGALVPPSPPPWDDCFPYTEIALSPLVRWPGALELVVESRASDYVVFTEPEDALCVEPQTGPPDALNLDPAIAAPGDPESITATFAWRTL
jgi:aldose 1-epimerase